MKKSQVVVTAALASVMTLSAVATPFVPLASAVEQPSQALVADVEALAKTQADIQNLTKEIKNLDGYKAYEEFNIKSAEKQQGTNYGNLASIHGAVDAYVQGKGGEAVENGNMAVAVAIEGLEKNDEQVQKANKMRELIKEAEKNGSNQKSALEEVQKIANESFGLDITDDDIMTFRGNEAAFKDKVIGKAGAETIGKELREVSWVISQNQATTAGLLAERDQIEELLALYVGMGGKREDIAANRVDAIVDEVKTEATYKNYTDLDAEFAKADRNADNLAKQETSVKNSYNSLVKLAKDATGADVSNEEKDARKALEDVKNLDGYKAYQAYQELSKNVPATTTSYGANAAAIAGNLSAFLNKTIASDDVSVAKAIETAKQDPEMQKALRFVHAYQNATTPQAIADFAALATELYGVEFTESDPVATAADVMNKVQPEAPNTIAAATDIYNNEATTEAILAEDALREEMIGLYEKMGGTRAEATNNGVTSTLSGINWTIKNSDLYNNKYAALNTKVASVDGALNKIANFENGFDATYNKLVDLGEKATGVKVELPQQPTTPTDPVYVERELKDDATGITVKGKFLEGYTLLVNENPYRADIDRTNQAFYDIEVIDLDGKPVTLTEAVNGPITVSMPLPKDMNVANKIEVMHIAFADDGSTVNGTIVPHQIQDGMISFVTTHFSLYGIVEYLPTQDDTKRPTINDGTGSITIAGQQTTLTTEDGVYNLTVAAPNTGAEGKTTNTAVASVAVAGIASVLGAAILATKRFLRRKN